MALHQIIHPTFAFLGGISTYELLIVLGIVVLLFGSSKLPQLARSIGLSMTEFKKGLKEGESTPTGNPADSSEKV
jgi:sec-independent protein translocase protein TatA